MQPPPGQAEEHRAKQAKSGQVLGPLTERVAPQCIGTHLGRWPCLMPCRSIEEAAAASPHALAPPPLFAGAGGAYQGEPWGSWQLLPE